MVSGHRIEFACRIRSVLSPALSVILLIVWHQLCHCDADHVDDVVYGDDDVAADDAASDG